MKLHGSKKWCGLFLVMGVMGCDVSDPSKVPARTSVVTPPGVAPVGFDIQDAGRAAPAQPQQPAVPGAVNPMAVNPQPVQQPLQQPVPQAQPMPQAAPANDGKGIIGKTTNQVVDMRAAMAQNPNLKIVENKAAGDDPITFAASAYVSARSRASMFGFEAALKQHKVVEGRPPTYTEFQTMMKENRVEFTAQYAWRMYAYDEVEGRLVVLEDPALKPAQ